MQLSAQGGLVSCSGNMCAMPQGLPLHQYPPVNLGSRIGQSEGLAGGEVDFTERCNAAELTRGDRRLPS